ncbi:MAG: hypothetical protein V7631_4247 [Massilia sp.]|jgi:hypothetical protein
MPIPSELFETITGRLDPARGPAVVDDAIGLWHAMMNKFRPLLGPLSTELLLVRALELSEAQFPWLGCAHERNVALPPFDTLRSRLTQRTPQEIVDANRAVCTLFISQLVELIGPRLTERFLRSAFPDNQQKGNQLGESA